MKYLILGAKYIRFCKSRQEDDEGIQSIQGISQRSSIPTVSSTIPIPQPARSFSSSNYSKRNRNGSTRLRSSDESEDSFRNTRTATPGNNNSLKIELVDFTTILNLRILFLNV